MITEIVSWRLSDQMSREDAVNKFRASVPTWRANPDLIHKAFLFDEGTRRAGGVYLWKNMMLRSTRTVKRFRSASVRCSGPRLSFSISRRLLSSTMRRSR